MTKLSALLLAAATFAAWPAVAQTTPTPPSTNAPAKPKAAPFRGTIASVDAATMTLTLRGRGSNPGSQIKVISTTKIYKDKDPGQFTDAVEGMRVTGEGKKGDDGVWTASTLHITKPTPKAAPAPAPAPTQ